MALLHLAFFAQGCHKDPLHTHLVSESVLLDKKSLGALVGYFIQGRGNLLSSEMEYLSMQHPEMHDST